MAMDERERYEALLLRTLAALSPENRLAALSPEPRLAALSLEQRLVALSLEQGVPFMPDGRLRGLPPEFLAMLSEATRTAVHARIGR